MTEKSAAYWLQVAVNERLKLTIPNVPISEKTQKNTEPPYIELYDTAITSTIQSKTNTIRRLRMTIRVFDESENADTVKDTIDDIIAAITSTPLMLEGGFSCYLTTHERTEASALLKDQKTWRGVTIFDFSVQQNA